MHAHPRTPSAKPRRSMQHATPRHSAHRTWNAPVIALLMLAGLIAGAIIISSITRHHVQFDDGSVWITSLEHGKAARFNVKNREADAGVASVASRFDVVQHNAITMITEPSSIRAIDAATIGISATASLDSSMRTFIGADTIALLDDSTGDVWVGTASNLDDLSHTSMPPQMRLGRGGRVAVTYDGAVYGYRPEDGMVLRLAQPHIATPQEIGSLTDYARQAADGFTVIDGTPVIVSNHDVLTPAGKISLTAGNRLVLQQTPTDAQQTGWVAVASRQGLAMIRLRNGAVTKLPSGGSGEPAQPVSVNGCVHAAFSQQARNYVRVCSPTPSDSTAKFQSLAMINETTELLFRTNHRLVVLNDAASGNVWNPDDSDKAIAVQWDRIATDSDEPQRSEGKTGESNDFDITCSNESGRLDAIDDQMGVRAGTSRILDVLRNDHQTDCSALRITRVDALSDENATVSPVMDGRYLQFDATAAAPGEATFTYDISDGRGQTSTATVHIAVTGSGNHPPAQSAAPPHINVEQGARYQANALGEFDDPDGDPLTLVSANAHSEQVRVSTRADGKLIFDSGSLRSGRVAVDFIVSDGEATGTGILYFSIKPANSLSAILDTATVSTAPSVETVIDLSPYVHGTSAQSPSLSTVNAPDGASASIRDANLLIAFQSSNPGTHYVSYAVSQGTMQTTGYLRMEVQVSADNPARPIAVTDVALLDVSGDSIVEPLRNDIDPTGGVLSITSILVPTDSGVATGVIENKRVYITARQLPRKPITLTYTATNAVGNTQGTIVLHPPLSDEAHAFPIASDIHVQVRTGGIVSVDALDHVNHPDATSISLKKSLRTDANSFQGLAFVANDAIRYQAGNEPGTYSAEYTVEDDFGNTDSATITFVVHNSRINDKAAPIPHDVEAQVPAGRKVRIPITLTGIDTDGDEVQLLGLGNAAPAMGRVTEVGSDYLVYEAYADSRGTDVFSYAVEDWAGQRAQAKVRVGIFTNASNSGIHARDDAITLRPRTNASVPVALNDISSDGTSLSVDSTLVSQGIAGASVQDNSIVFTTPDAAATAYVEYTVRDQSGLSDTAILTVTVDPQAEIESPIAYDYRVPPSETINRRTIEVDVSRWIANPSGPMEQLAISVHDSASTNARMKGGKHSTVISIDLIDQARAIPYMVTNTAHHLVSTAFIHVPAYGVFPPMLRPKTPNITVNAHESIDIDINDYVRVGAGKYPHIDDTTPISATKAANTNWRVNDTTLRFTAIGNYSGPASITFTATDGLRGNGTTIINSAVITLNITIIGRETPPPTFTSSIVDLEAGAAAKTIDLTALTHSPSDFYANERQYTYSGGLASDQRITASVSQQGMLQVSVAASTSPGVTIPIPIIISYGNGTVHSGITVRVCASTRPLARVQSRTITIKAGSSTSIALLDNAYNPFPGMPLTVTACSTDNSTGIIATCSDSGTMTITAKTNIGAISSIARVSVRDGTAYKKREVAALITIAVIDRPGAPLISPLSDKPTDSAVNLSWSPGLANGSPITDYIAHWTGASQGSKNCGATTSCRITGLINGSTYTITISAQNAVGRSDPSAAIQATPDKTPSAPSKVTVAGDHLMATVNWNSPEGSHSPILRYRVTLSLSNGQSLIAHTDGETSHRFILDNSQIMDGITATATVSAINAAGEGAHGNSKEPAAVWGSPEAIGQGMVRTAQYHADAGRIAVTLSALPNLHNAGCDRLIVELTGKAAQSVSCDALGAVFALDKDDFETRLTGTITLKTTRASGKTISGSRTITPVYQPKPPANVKLSRSGSTCTVTYAAAGAYHDGFIVTSNGTTLKSGISSTSYAITPWQSCGTITVRQTFKSRTSDPVEVADTVLWKIPASITAPTLSWKDEANTIAVEGGAVNAYGISVGIRIVVNGQSFDWRPGQYELDVSTLAEATTYQWHVSVVGTDDPVISADTSASAATIFGTRPSKVPEEQPLQPSDGGSEPDINASPDAGTGASTGAGSSTGPSTDTETSVDKDFSTHTNITTGIGFVLSHGGSSATTRKFPWPHGLASIYRISSSHSNKGAPHEWPY